MLKTRKTDIVKSFPIESISIPQDIESYLKSILGYYVLAHHAKNTYNLINSENKDLTEFLNLGEENVLRRRLMKLEEIIHSLVTTHQNTYNQFIANGYPEDIAVNKADNLIFSMFTNSLENLLELEPGFLQQAYIGTKVQSDKIAKELGQYANEPLLIK